MHPWTAIFSVYLIVFNISAFKTFVTQFSVIYVSIMQTFPFKIIVNEIALFMILKLTLQRYLHYFTVNCTAI